VQPSLPVSPAPCCLPLQTWPAKAIARALRMAVLRSGGFAEFHGTISPMGTRNQWMSIR
jgi:hypothetical protein